jgi:hypothetical protein
MAREPKRGPGRPRKGPDGQAVRQLPALTVRLAVPVMARLVAVAKVRGVSPSVVVSEALDRELPNQIAATDARTVGALARREAERLRARPV